MHVRLLYFVDQGSAVERGYVALDGLIQRYKSGSIGSATSAANEVNCGKLMNYLMLAFIDYLTSQLVQSFIQFNYLFS